MITFVPTNPNQLLTRHAQLINTYHMSHLIHTLIVAISPDPIQCNLTLQNGSPPIMLTTLRQVSIIQTLTNPKSLIHNSHTTISRQTYKKMNPRYSNNYSLVIKITYLKKPLKFSTQYTVSPQAPANQPPPPTPHLQPNLRPHTLGLSRA